MDAGGELTALAPRLRAFVRRHIRNDADADDVAQDVLLRAYRKIGSLRDPQRVSAWTYRIARNAVLDHARRVARAPAPLPLDSVAQSAIATAGPETAPPAEAAIAGSLRAMVADLPPRYRRAVALTHFDGMTQRQLAKRLGLSPSGAKSQVQRGRALLREAVLECCDLDLDSGGRIADYHARRRCDC